MRQPDTDNTPQKAQRNEASAFFPPLVTAKSLPLSFATTQAHADPAIKLPRRMLCTDCQSGYHAPYDRFERLAANPKVPSFLMRCRQCGALWNETSGVPELLTRTHARDLYPRARI